MSAQEDFYPLWRFAEVGRLVGNIYSAVSPACVFSPELRDFFMGMAREQERRASVLTGAEL